LQALTVSADASLQKFLRACRAINGDLTVVGPRMDDFSTASYDLSVRNGRLTDLYEGLQKPPEDNLFTKTRDSMMRKFRQPACMAQINKQLSDELSTAETLIKKLQIDCEPAPRQQ
jgi:hypothetical protein